MKIQALLLLCCSLHLNAQQPFGAEIDCLRNGFHRQYIRQEKVGVLDSCDVFYQCGKGSTGSIGDKQLRIVYDDALHQTDGYQLPPSRFVVVEEELPDGHSRAGKLYWMGPLEMADSKENVRLAKQMRKRYGCQKLSDSLECVPARWFTGSLHVLARPFAYGGEAVSRRMLTYRVEQGVVVPTEKGRLYVDDFTYHGADREASILCGMRADGKMDIRLDGKTSPEEHALESRRGLHLFASGVNSLMDANLLPADLECALPVMLYLDTWGKAHLYALSEQLTAQERLLLALLSGAVASQPANVFRPYWCGRGAFPAIYLEARLKNRKWSFVDYRFK
ncbi:MAG: hypothetical protein ACI3X9_10550 [Bacteroidaceae bacterium]